MSRIALSLLILLLSDGFVHQPSACSESEQRANNQLLALAEIYENAGTWDKASEIYAQVALSACDEQALAARNSLQHSMHAQQDPMRLIGGEWDEFLVSTAGDSLRVIRFLVLSLVAIGTAYFLAKLLFNRINQEKWIILPFNDLTGHEMGEGVAELLSNKIHEVRFVHAEQLLPSMGLSENVDLPSFSATSQRETLLTGLAGLDSLDVSGIGLPFGTALSSTIRWIDLGGRRVSGTIQTNGAAIEIRARLEQGRRGLCHHVWRVSKQLSAGEKIVDALPNLIDQLSYRILFDVVPDRWGTRSVDALFACTEGLRSLRAYYNTNSRDKVSLLDAHHKLADAYRIDPTYELASFNLALVELNLTHFDQALSLFRTLKDASDERMKLAARYNMGVAYYNKTSDWAYDQAELAFKSVIDG